MLTVSLSNQGWCLSSEVYSEAQWTSAMTEVKDSNASGVPVWLSGSGETQYCLHKEPGFSKHKDYCLIALRIRELRLFPIS